MKDCSKCGTNSVKPGGYLFQGGNAYYFCDLCLRILEDLSPAQVGIYLNENGEDLIENDINRDIIKARVRRKNNQSPWK